MPKHFKCDKCDKQFTDRYYLASHQYVHTNDTPFACPQCSYRGKTKKYLARHIRKVHTDKTGEHKCNVCGKVFHHHSNMKVHAMVHTGEKPHSCKVCGKTFRVTYSLNSHMLIHKNEKPFECSFCDYACRDSSTLRKHQNKHMGIQKTYECNICNKGYSALAKLKVHIAEQHLDIDVKKYPCQQCNKVFKSSGHRKRHVDCVHKRTLVCTCPICGRRLMNKNNLSTHMRGHLEERPFSCTHSGCGLAFKDKGTLKKHIVIHKPPNYACSHCDRKFSRKTHLTYHERVMHLERQRGVECDYCGSRFYSKNYLLKHIQTKHVYKQEFKYICDICGLTTHNKPSIVMHLKYGHSNDHDMQCKICDNKMVYKKHTYLKMHYWKVHNIRYKITRKATNSLAARKERREKNALVEVKVEPVETDYEEIELMDIKKLEHEDEDECSEYSRRVLAEDMTYAHGARSIETDFDACFVRRVIGERRIQSHEIKPDGVNTEQDRSVKCRIKQIITTTNKIEKAKKLKAKRKIEDKLKRKRERKEAQLEAERQGQEIVELTRVREMYNERMKAALAKQNEKKEKVKIKYFKIPETNTDTTKNNASTKNIDKTYIEEVSNNEEQIEKELDNKDMTINKEGTCNINKENSDTEVFDNENDHNNTKNDETYHNTEETNNFSKENDDRLLSDDENHQNNADIGETNQSNERACEDDDDAKLTDIDNHQNDTDDGEVSQNCKEIDDSTKDNQNAVLSDDKNLENIIENDETGHTKRIRNNNQNNDTDDENHENTAKNDEAVNNTKGIRYNNQNNDDTVDENHQNTAKNDEAVNNTTILHINPSNGDTDDENHQNKAKNINYDGTITKGNDDINIENNTNNTNNESFDFSTDNEILSDTDNNIIKNASKDNKNDSKESINNEIESESDDSFDKPLLERRNKKRSKKVKKMEFKTFQCYICFKLYETKDDLMSHCQEHYDMCHSVTLSKCPLCGYVSHKGIAPHLKLKHEISLKIPIHRMKKQDGGYICHANGTTVEIIPSVKILNKVASDTIDKKKREINNQTIAKPKLVKIKNNWIVAKEAIPIEYDEIPEISDRDMHKLKISDNDVDRLGQLSRVARNKSLKMMYPCFKCDKICQTFSALKLHKRRHEENPVPFKPKVKKCNKTININKPAKLNIANRTAFPKAIKNNHKCDEKLKEFYESNIRGGDIEFWQFLKIYNKMTREKIEDFKDLENRTDFGNHLDYYKDVASDGEVE